MRRATPPGPYPSYVTSSNRTPSTSPVPRLIARSMFSVGTEKSLAFSTAEASVMFPSMFPPPSRAATSIARRSFAYMLLRLASFTAFLRLIELHLECPDILSRPLDFLEEILVQRGLSDQLRVKRRRQQVPLLDDDGPAVMFGQHADLRADVLDPRRPNK